MSTTRGMADVPVYPVGTWRMNQRSCPSIVVWISWSPGAGDDAAAHPVELVGTAVAEACLAGATVVEAMDESPSDEQAAPSSAAAAKTAISPGDLQREVWARGVATSFTISPEAWIGRQTVLVRDCSTIW